MYNASNTNTAYDTFLNKLIPVVNKRVRAYSDARKPWISSGLIKSISRKNSLYKNYLRKKISLASERYKKHKNMLTNLIRTSQRLYYQDKCNSAMGDITKTWHVLKNIVNIDYSTKPCVTEIKINNQLIIDQNIIAQKFNEYFVSIGPNLAETIDLVKDAPGDAVSYNSGHYTNSIFLTNASPSEIRSIVFCLKFTSSSGYYGIPPSLIKQVYSGIALPLSDIFNKALTSGIFPNQMKIAKIIPSINLRIDTRPTNLSLYFPSSQKCLNASCTTDF